MHPVIEGALKSKTMWFSTALGGLGVVQATLKTFTPLLDPTMVGILVTVIGACVAGLRMVTKGSLTDKTLPEVSIPTPLPLSVYHPSPVVTTTTDVIPVKPKKKRNRKRYYKPRAK